MIDFYLVFSNEAAAKAELYDLQEGDEDVLIPRYKNIDIVGTIYKPTGKTRVVEGMTIPVMAAIPGWHVNVRLMPDEDGTPLEQYRVFPNTPSRVWA
jgi:hypothetical protein